MITKGMTTIITMTATTTTIILTTTKTIKCQTSKITTKIMNKEENNIDQTCNSRTNHSDKTGSINSQNNVRIDKTFRIGNDCRGRSSLKGE